VNLIINQEKVTKFMCQEPDYPNINNICDWKTNIVYLMCNTQCKYMDSSECRLTDSFVVRYSSDVEITCCPLLQIDMV